MGWAFRPLPSMPMMIAALMLAVPSVLIVRVNMEKLSMAQAEVAGLAPAGDTVRLLQKSTAPAAASSGP